MIAMITIFLALIFYAKSETFDEAFSVYSTNAQYYFGLNNDFAELVPSAYEITTEDEYNSIQGLTGIIGHLPFAEQASLLKALGTTTLFNFDTYFAEIQTGADATPVSITKNIFRENSKALSTYITESEKRLSKGLGCFKKVSNTFGYDFKEDEEKAHSVSLAINAILEAKAQANYCTAVFLDILQGNMIKRRAYLFDLKAIHILNDKAGFTQNTYFTYKNKKICGIRYSTAESKKIVEGFKEYALCQHNYKNVLHRRIIEIELLITRMSRCVDRDNPNKNAGNSSTVSVSPNITYNSDHEQIGVNNASMIRPDQMTLNNFYLDKGFGLGTISQNIVLDYPSFFRSSVLGALYEDLKKDSFFNTFLVVFGSLISPSLEQKPFSNLIQTILNTKSIAQDSSNTILTSYKTELLKNLQTNCVDKWFLKCKSNEECSCAGTCPASFTPTLKLENPPDSSNPFFLSEISLYVACRDKLPAIFVTTATNKILGNVFDINYQGQSLGAQSMSNTQSCIGVFTSGMKNDKDACRDTITEKCGTELDYQCKKSGLYDFLNESPVSSSYLPFNCTDTTVADLELECLKWIDRHFILGTIAVKPSAFASYNLNAQSSAIKYPNINLLDHYCEAEKQGTGATLPTHYTALETLSGDTEIKKNIFVDKISLNEPSNRRTGYLETDKEYINLLTTASAYIRFHLILVFFFFLLNID